MILLRLLPLWLALPLAAQELIPVTGVVRHALTGNPLPNILLTLTRTDAPAPESALASPPDGRFAFRVPPGVYRLMAESPAYGGQVYGAAFQSGAGVSLRLAPGDRPAPLDFPLIPPAALSGRITDPHGEPVANALVQLFQLRLIDGRQGLSARASAYTNDQGHYRFSGLAAAPYFLAVSAIPWHSTYPADEPGQAHFRPRFYPAASTPEGASALTLTAGQEARADFQLEEGEAPGVEINLDPPTEGANLTLQLRAPGLRGLPRYHKVERLIRSSHDLEGIPPGEYEVVVVGTASGRMVRGAARFTLADTPLRVTVPVGPSPTLAGRLDCTGRLAPSALSFYDPLQIARVSVSLAAGGTFLSPPLNPGVYSVLLNSPDCYVHRVTVAGQPVAGNRITVGAVPVTDIRIETRADVGSLHGVLRRGEAAVSGVPVYLVPDPADETRPARQFVTDSDGSFDFDRLPPGRYVAFVAPGAPELFEYADPAAAARYRQSGAVVEVAPRQRLRLDLAWPAANGQTP